MVKNRSNTAFQSIIGLFCKAVILQAKRILLQIIDVGVNFRILKGNSPFFFIYFLDGHIPGKGSENVNNISHSISGFEYFI